MQQEACRNGSQTYKGQGRQVIGPASVQRTRLTTGQSPSRFWATGRLFTPVLAPFLWNRWFALLLAGIATLQVGLVAAGLDGWPCPVKATLRVPCPGCGLSTAMVLLLRGEWHAALSMHAFAPIFLLGLILMTVSAVLPGRLHRRVVGRIAALECQTGIVTFVLLSLVVYWGVRLLGLS
jgi:hypothetical protein